MLKTFFVAIILVAAFLCVGTGYEIYHSYGQAVMDPGFPCPSVVACETHAGRAVWANFVGFGLGLFSSIGFTLTAIVTKGRMVE
jgi:uncharacterized membrane protein